MRSRRRRLACPLLLLSQLLAAAAPAAAQETGSAAPSREEVARALHRAADFYRTRVANQGGYHYDYSEDLSFGRSEHGEGPTQVEVQPGATPGVGVAYLAAYEATGDRYYLDAAREAAHLLVQGQLCSGGWDYLIELEPASRQHYLYRTDGCDRPVPEEEAEPHTTMRAARRSGANTTTLDDNVTQGALRFLMRVDRELGFADAAIHDAALYALERIMAAQYPVGAWPQRYDHAFRPDSTDHPVLKASYPESWSREYPGHDFKRLYTVNDGTIADLIDMFLEAARIYGDGRYRAAAGRGGEFILRAQMPEPQPGWAQQYDFGMRPAWARRFEPPSITGGEAQNLMKILLVLYRETGDRRYLEPIPRAVGYYRASSLPPLANPTPVRARHCREGTKYCLARFYELQTNRPLYFTNGSRVSVGSGFASWYDGYELTHSDESVITHYGLLSRGDELDEIERERERLLRADPATLRRPERLVGLSPQGGVLRDVSGARHAPTQERDGVSIASILHSMDARGAWTEEGSIGTPDRVAWVYAGEDLIVRLGDRVFTLKEDETLQVFRGGEPPKERIVSSRTFIRNVEALSAYLKSEPVSR